MIINHNIAALNTQNQLASNQSQVQGSLEKLSSGLRINNASDDAAGLAISEKMRGQIQGLEMAERNAQDGVSLIQTAEGAMGESQAILQRMRELSVQSSNDTNTTEDRAQLQKEVDQLAQGLTDISTDTEFNTKNLVDGSFQDQTFHVGANENQNIKVSIGDMSAESLGVRGDAKISGAENGSDTGTETAVNGGGDITTPDGTSIDIQNTSVNSSPADELTMSVKVTDGNGSTSSVDLINESGDGKTFTNADEEISVSFDTSKSAEESVSFIATGTPTGGQEEFEATSHDLAAGNYTVNENEAGTSIIQDQNGETVATHAGGGTYNAVDAEGNDTGEEALTTGTSGTLAEGSEISVGGIDISSQESANEAITTINSAIQQVSDDRANLGAVQNRLDHTMNNLSASSENLTAAESRIRDVDMAQEMMEFTKNNVLTQAAQSMLAQANQQPQGVLQLLQ